MKTSRSRYTIIDENGQKYIRYANGLTIRPDKLQRYWQCMSANCDKTFRKYTELKEHRKIHYI